MTDDVLILGPEDFSEGITSAKNTPKSRIRSRNAAEKAAEDLGTPEDEAEGRREGETRARAAAKLAVHGAEDWEIAEQLNYTSPQAARAAWESIIASTLDPTVDLKSLRRLRNSQLEAMIKSLAPKAMHDTILVDDPDNKGKKKRVKNDEHLAYNQQLLRVLDRAIKLQGLDAPQVVSLITPGVQEFERVVGMLTAAARSDVGVEADPFDEIEGEFTEGDDEPEEDPDE